MERNEFLTKFGIGIIAVCTGCGIASCGSNPKAGDPTPTNTNPPAGSGALFTADLNTELINIGDKKVSQGVILVRIAAGNTASSFTAVQVACTHQGTSINYNVPQGIFICPNHGSEFSTGGAVLLGPASLPLQKYTVVTSGTTLQVVA